MKIELKEFQLKAVEELLGQFDSARFEAVSGKSQAVSLVSPTGSGKTVIATALIERVLEGDDLHSPDPDATFLWLTDQPELNEQTRNKMLATSSILGPGRLTILDEKGEGERLDPGRVYFLNTQKLGQNSRLVRQGDDGELTLWELLSNTIDRAPTNFYVIIDEAHRGMHEKRDREEANSIIQKFIKGAEGQIPPVPLIFAISATIERFNEVVSRTPRVKRQWEVPVEDVRESGLLKEAINLFHPDEPQTSDITMLRQAAQSWIAFQAQWATYCEEEEIAPIEPVLLIQVEDGSGNRISRTDLAEVIAALDDELDSPPAECFAHAFQQGGAVKVGARSIRYIQPSAISDDRDVKVVFFKTSLNTGWDCPRAEVMMSFRAAKDDTSIAQLVGRMVRAPLARRILKDEQLDAVALYLPHYDSAGLRRVIDRLQADDPSGIPPTEVREGREVSRLKRVAGSDEVTEVLEGLPSYTVPRKRITSQVRRLRKLATALSAYGVDEEAPDKAIECLVEKLIEERHSREENPQFAELVKDSGVIAVRRVEWRYQAGMGSGDVVEVPISDENVNDLFGWAGRRFGEGLHKAFWKRRSDEGVENHRIAKLEAYALASSDDVMEALQLTARDRVQQLLKDFGPATRNLPEAGTQAINEVRGLAQEPEIAPITYPEAIEAAVGSSLYESYERHIYVDIESMFSFNPTAWERLTLEEELERPDLVLWLRNPDRKPWSLCVPYEMGKVTKGCYPDFIVVRRVGGSFVADIVDPHLLSFEDAWHRARGLAKFASRHADAFGRIEMVRVQGSKVERLDLIDENLREQVLDVSSNAHLRKIFDDLH